MRGPADKGFQARILKTWQGRFRLWQTG